MYHSIISISLMIMVSTIAILYFISNKHPLLVFRALWDNRKNKKLWLHFFLLAIILLFNKLELLIEQSFIHIPDKSGLFHQYEGAFLSTLQEALRADWLTELTTFFYIIVFVALIASSFIYYFTQKSRRLFYTFIYAIGLNYLIAIPFYLFFPVNEVWAVHGQVHFLIPEVYPAFESQYRHLSGLNNCFPSLHNSISLTLLLLSYQTTNKRFKALMTVSVAIIMFSTIYLGIHWITDQAAGIALAFVAFYAAKAISRMIEQPTRPFKVVIPGTSMAKQKLYTNEVKTYKKVNM